MILLLLPLLLLLLLTTSTIVLLKYYLTPLQSHPISVLQVEVPRVHATPTTTKQHAEMRISKVEYSPVASRGLPWKKPFFP